MPTIFDPKTKTLRHMHALPRDERPELSEQMRRRAAILAHTILTVPEYNSSKEEVVREFNSIVQVRPGQFLTSDGRTLYSLFAAAADWHRLALSLRLVRA